MWRIIGLGRAERFHRALNRSPHMQGIERKRESTNRLEHIELHACNVRSARTSLNVERVVSKSSIVGLANERLSSQICGTYE